VAQVGAARAWTDRRRAPAAGGAAVWQTGAAIPASQASARALAWAIPAVVRAGADAGGAPRHAGAHDPAVQGAERRAGAAAASAAEWAWGGTYPLGHAIL